MTRWGKSSGDTERRLLSLRGVEIGPVEEAALEFVGPVPVTKRAWIVIYTALKEVPKGEMSANGLKGLPDDFWSQIPQCGAATLVEIQNVALEYMRRKILEGDDG